MPFRAKIPCSISNCKEFQYKYGKCKKHWKEYVHDYNQSRDKASLKLYASQSWDRLRLKHLLQQPYCIICNTTARLEVDHILPHNGNPKLFFNEANLQTLCKQCHSSKTMNEMRNNL